MMTDKEGESSLCMHYLCDSSKVHDIHNPFYSHLYFVNVHVPYVQDEAIFRLQDIVHFEKNSFNVFCLLDSVKYESYGRDGNHVNIFWSGL